MNQDEEAPLEARTPPHHGWKHRSQCSLCGAARLRKVLNLTSTPIANEFVSEPRPQMLVPLSVDLCLQCGHSQISQIVSPDILFGSYVYETGTSLVTQHHFNNLATNIIEICQLTENSTVVEIGSNDGTLLRALKRGGISKVWGVDPAGRLADKYQADAPLDIIKDFFSLDTVDGIVEKTGRVDCVVACNVLAHIEDVGGMFQAIHTLLKPKGVLVFEVSHILDMHTIGSYDTIYHEHLSYHALTPLCSFLDSIGMPILRAKTDPNQHGRGSLQVWCQKRELGDRASIDGNGVSEIVAAELEAELTRPTFWGSLQGKIEALGHGMRSWLNLLSMSGKKIAAYGAPAKMTTMIYSLGLAHEQIRYVVDDSPWKKGLYCPGTHIPVVSFDKLKSDPPDVLIIFAWNFAFSILERLRKENVKGRYLLPIETVGADMSPMLMFMGQKSNARMWFREAHL